MADTIQLRLNGEELDKPIEFDCPLCKKHIILKRDEKGNVYHRPWVFHFMYDHANKHPEIVTKIKDSLSVWLFYFSCNDAVRKELVDEWKANIE